MNAALVGVFAAILRQPSAENHIGTILRFFFEQRQKGLEFFFTYRRARLVDFCNGLRVFFTEFQICAYLSRNHQVLEGELFPAYHAEKQRGIFATEAAHAAGLYAQTGKYGRYVKSLSAQIDAHLFEPVQFSGLQFAQSSRFIKGWVQANGGNHVLVFLSVSDLPIGL